MKITKQQKSVTAIAIAALVLSTGTYYIIDGNLNSSNSAYAYTSTLNPQDPATAQDDYVVNIPDVNLRAALNKVLTGLDKNTNPAAPERPADAQITAGDLKRPVNMYGPLGLNGTNNGPKISNLEGAQFLVNATRIDAVVNNITDVSPLKDLTKLESLSLSRNQIVNVEQLKSLPNLKVLNLAGNQVTDVAPLSQIPNLENLDIENNPNLTDISTLATAPKLKELNITSTRVNNLTPISASQTIEKLYMRVDGARHGC